MENLIEGMNEETAQVEETAADIQKKIDLLQEKKKAITKPEDRREELLGHVERKLTNTNHRGQAEAIVFAIEEFFKDAFALVQDLKEKKVLRNKEK